MDKSFPNPEHSGKIFSFCAVCVLAVTFIAALIPSTGGPFDAYAGIVLSQGSILACVLIFCAICKVNVLKATKTNTVMPDAKAASASVIIGIVIATAVMIPLMFAIEGFNALGYNPSRSFDLGGNNAANIILQLALCCVLPGIVEEMLFRGIMLRGLRKFGDAFAIIVSALLFSLFHCNAVQTVFPFIAGLVLGLIFVKTGNLVFCMIAHALNNAMSILYDVWLNKYIMQSTVLLKMNTFYITVFEVIAGVICLLVLAACLFVLFKTKTVKEEVPEDFDEANQQPAVFNPYGGIFRPVQQDEQLQINQPPSYDHRKNLSVQEQQLSQYPFSGPPREEDVPRSANQYPEYNQRYNKQMKNATRRTFFLWALGGIIFFALFWVLDFLDGVYHFL